MITVRCNRNETVNFISQDMEFIVTFRCSSYITTKVNGVDVTSLEKSRYRMLMWTDTITMYRKAMGISRYRSGMPTTQCRALKLMWSHIIFSSNKTVLSNMIIFIGTWSEPIGRLIFNAQNLLLLCRKNLIRQKLILLPGRSVRKIILMSTIPWTALQSADIWQNLCLTMKA